MSIADTGHDTCEIYGVEPLPTPHEQAWETIRWGARCQCGHKFLNQGGYYGTPDDAFYAWKLHMLDETKGVPA